MKYYVAFVSSSLLVLCLSIIALAGTDGQQSGQESVLLTIVDLRSIILGASGGLLSSIASIAVCYMQNKHAIKLQKKGYDYNIKKILNEERRMDCISFLHETNPDTIITGTFSIEKALFACNKIEISCPYEYSTYANNLIKLLLTTKALVKFSIKDFKDDEEKKLNAKKTLIEYKKFHSVVVCATRLMFEGKKLKPAGEWNLDDFEGSVPLDSRPPILLISPHGA